jgi:hypothetical protein
LSNLIALARVMVTAPGDILRKLAETALMLCHAGSSGISQSDPDDEHVIGPPSLARVRIMGAAHPVSTDAAERPWTATRRNSYPILSGTSPV